MLLAHGRECVILTNAYLEESPNTRPRDPNVDWVYIGNYVSHRLELVQKLHDFVPLVGEVYPAVVASP
jgi:hypothetical protein